MMRRAALTAGGIVIGGLVLTAVMPLAGDAGLRQKPKPVRGRNVAVGGLTPGSRPAGVHPPSDAATRPQQKADDDRSSDGGRASDTGADPSMPGDADVVADAIVLDAGMDFNLVGAMGRRAGGKHEDAHVGVRSSLDGEVWSEWMTLTLESAPGDVSARRLVAEPCWVGEARYVQFVSDGPVQGLELSFVNSLGETTLADRALDVVGKVATVLGRLWHSDVASATASKPAIVSRSAWGANESLRRADPDTAPVKMAFVHHTASGDSYSPSQAPAVVRAVYYYHVKGAGFNDLGYNFLIDRYGTIYEGRYGGISEGVVGAHTLGFNTNSTGVALMGTFTSSPPPSAALTSLKKLLAWKLDVHHVNPTASARMICRASEKYDAGQAVDFAAISGHRNANFTSCPGNALYGNLPSVRTAVAKRGLPKIYAPTVSPTLFSPDGDGRADTTTVRFSASETVNWSLQISAADGTVVRRFSGSGRSVSRIWDGDDASGARVADGAYTVRVTGESSRGAARAVEIGVASVTQPASVTLGLSADEVAPGTRVTYSGTVTTAAGAPAAGTVTVQKRRGGGDWIQWRTAELDANGNYAVTVDMVNRQTWEFRACMPGDGGLNETGYSAVAGLTVGPPPGVYGPGECAFTITGRGWGHGIGMSQWGAYGLAKHGRGYKAILRRYYTGIGFAKVKNSTVRVLLRKGVGTVKLTCTGRYTVTGGSGTSTIPGGTTATVTRSGADCRVVAGSFSRVFRSAVTFTPTRARLNVRTATDLGQTGRHRGRIRVATYGSSLMMVNLVALESYLRAVVPHEVSPSWPAAALRAQACAARAYAESARRSSTGQWDLYCDVRSQAYGGMDWESARTNAAVAATAGVVPVYGGRPIQAFYFSCSGGRTENIEYAWQTSAVPYLKGVKDPYDGSAPLHTWGPLRRTSAQIEQALTGDVKGSLRAIYRVKAGTSPRIVKAAVIGSAGTTFLHGSTLRTKLGLNSVWATIRSMSVRPSGAEDVVVSHGEKVTISGCVYPALASGATVTLRYGRPGAWSSRQVPTVRHARKLGSGSTARYSTYKVEIGPTQTAQYYFQRGVARSPRTTITVK